MEADYVLGGDHSIRESYRGPVLGEEVGDIDINMWGRYNFEFSNNGIRYELVDGKFVKVQLNSAENYARFHLVSLIEKHRQSGSKVPLKSVLLACTHYPFMLSTLESVIKELRGFRENGAFPYRRVIANDFKFIDPAQFTVMECYEILRGDSNLSLRSTDSAVEAVISIPSKDVAVENLDSLGNFIYDFKYGREIGTEDETSVFVPFSNKNISRENVERIKMMLPSTYSILEECII